MDPVTAARHLLGVKQYTTASYALAAFEYFITFDREYDMFWKRKFTFPTVLWFLNRYTLYFSAVPTLMGFHVPLSETQCRHFVKYPGVMQIISNVASGTTLSIRVYALYGQAWWVIVILFPVFIAEIALESWAVEGGVPVQLPNSEVGCILTGKPNEGIKFAVFWMGQLVFPTLIFVMTLTRALRLRGYGALKGSVLNVMLRDGVMYFLVIFIVNLANVLTYAIAPVDLKFANAPFTNVITTVMICRLMLNLRRPSEPEPVSTNTSFFNTRGDDRTRRTLLVGDLGEDIDINNSNDKARRHESRWSEANRPRKRDIEHPEYELNTMSSTRSWGGNMHG